MHAGDGHLGVPLCGVPECRPDLQEGHLCESPGHFDGLAVCPTLSSVSREPCEEGKEAILHMENQRTSRGSPSFLGVAAVVTWAVSGPWSLHWGLRQRCGAGAPKGPLQEAQAAGP